jgi:NADPH:quinone reductase-like Zn-dependent oxidoreductase
VACVEGAPGGIEVVERPDPVPAPTEVLVDVAFAAINPADLEQAAGRYPAPPGVVPDIPGLEVAGRVVAVGDEVRGWRVGDRAFGLVGGGGLAGLVAADAGCVTPIPPALDDRTAAAIPEAFVTANDALGQAGVTAGSTVFVRGATGAVGSAAVQIARRSGATVVTALAPDAPSIGGASGVIGLGDPPDLVAAVRATTDGRGVDAVIELIGAATFPEDLRMLASRGTIVVVGLATGSIAELDLLRLMRSRATVRGTVLRSRGIDEKREAVEAFAAEVVPGFDDGALTAAIDSVFPIAEAREAFRRQAERGKRGKVVLEL